MSRPAARRLATILLLLTPACAVVRSPAPAPESSVLEHLVAPEAIRRTLRGLAAVRAEGPQGRLSFGQVVVVELPDRARLEVQSAVGVTALVLTLDGERLRYQSLFPRQYAEGRASRQVLGRLAGVPVPPGPLLRLLLGLPPLPLHRDDPRLTMEPEGDGFRIESVEGPLWQRLWTGGQGLLERGEVGESVQALFRFRMGDPRPVDGALFPFFLAIEEAGSERRLQLEYQSVRLNEPIPPDLFDLPRPTDPRTKILDLSGTR